MEEIELKNFSDNYIYDILYLFKDTFTNPNLIIPNHMAEDDLDIINAEIKQSIVYKVDFNNDYVDIPIAFYHRLPRVINRELGKVDFVLLGTNVSNENIYRNLFTNFGDTFIREVFTNHSIFNRGSKLQIAQNSDNKDEFYYYYRGIILGSDYTEILSVNYRIETSSGHIIGIIIKVNPRVLLNSGSLYRNMKNRLLCYLAPKSIKLESLKRSGNIIEINQKIPVTIEIGNTAHKKSYLEDFDSASYPKLLEEINSKAHSDEFIDSIFE